MATWIVERTQDRRFRFRVTIEQDGRPLRAVCKLPDGFEFGLLRRQFAEVKEVRLRRIVGQLRAEGRLRCEGRGRAARRFRVEPQDPSPARNSE